jgi:DNA-binding NarL/FixJ family response regulator
MLVSMNDPATLALVSRPGILQQALQTSLSACTGVVLAAALGDGLTALNYVAAHRPALLVVDCNLLDAEVEALLEAIKSRHLPTRCLVLTRTPQRATWALACGADAALLHDGSLHELQAVVANLRTSRDAPV